MMAMIGDVIEEVIVTTMDEEGSKEFGGAKDIFDDKDVMNCKALKRD